MEKKSRKNSASRSAAKKPVYTRWWFWVIAIIFLLGSHGDNEHAAAEAEPSVTESQGITTEIYIESTTAPISVYSVVDKFIELYGVDNISDIAELDIRGEDYRTEYRLTSFKGAVGKKGTIRGGHIEILNYGVWSNNSIRFYASVDTFEAATELCTTIIRVLDNSISDQEIAAQYEPFTHVNSANIYLGDTGFISGYINADYSNGGVAGYDVMIDCTKLNFID